VTQFRPAGFIASPLDAGLLRQRCSAAYYLPSGSWMITREIMAGLYVMKGDTKGHNRQKQQKL
ncbi:hypothetical protein, partial [uncultured Duncaniella sp.]